MHGRGAAASGLHGTGRRPSRLGHDVAEHLRVTDRGGSSRRRRYDARLLFSAPFFAALFFFALVFAPPFRPAAAFFARVPR